MILNEFLIKDRILYVYVLQKANNLRWICNHFLKKWKETVSFLGFIYMNSFMEEAFLNIPW